jgi:hypothetical protein
MDTIHQPPDSDRPPPVTPYFRRCPPLVLSPEQQARYRADLAEQAALRGLLLKPWAA